MTIDSPTHLSIPYNMIYNTEVVDKWFCSITQTQWRSNLQINVGHQQNKKGKQEGIELPTYEQMELVYHNVTHMKNKQGHSWINCNQFIFTARC